MTGSRRGGSDPSPDLREGTAVRFAARQRRMAKEVAAVLINPTEGAIPEVRRGRRTAALPTDLAAVLALAATAIGAGEAVTLVVGTPAGREDLSSQQAADLLNVSRPYVVKLARIGELPCRKVGNRHRFRYDDVMEYRQREFRRREGVLAALTLSEGYRPEDF